MQPKWNNTIHERSMWEKRIAILVLKYHRYKCIHVRHENMYDTKAVRSLTPRMKSRMFWKRAFYEAFVKRAQNLMSIVEYSSQPFSAMERPCAVQTWLINWQNSPQHQTVLPTQRFSSSFDCAQACLALPSRSDKRTTTSRLWVRYSQTPR